MPERVRILVVDDDQDLRTLYAQFLQSAGYLTEEVGEGELALQRLGAATFHLVLLDWQLPGLGGQSLLEAIGWRWPELPIIVMTGYSDEAKAVAAVEYAQSYLRKPFEKQELLEAVGRVLHRTNAIRTGDFPPIPGHGRPDFARDEAAPKPRRAGDVTVHPLRCEASVKERPPVALTASEYAVLNHLFVNAGEVVTHKALAHLLSPRPLSAKEAAALCKHHIRALRTKLEPDPTQPRYIVTVWGQGYCLMPDGQ